MQPDSNSMKLDENETGWHNEEEGFQIQASRLNKKTHTMLLKPIRISKEK
jgi:hypothetical protein